ncbi:hypothetical protein FACS1894102_5350 [Spirochaetia bacterium]|nr:hypothetical protein FACS1894102_5350 [Spirochaetia bacterium]
MWKLYDDEKNYCIQINYNINFDIRLIPVDINVSAGMSKNYPILFTEFLEKFWTYEDSSYVADLKLHNHSIGKSHCLKRLGCVKNYWKTAFMNKRLDEITRHDLKEFSLALRGKSLLHGNTKKVLSLSTINKIMTTGITALKWAFFEGMIQSNPTDGYVPFSENTKDRGVLTPLEAEKVFAAQWKSKHAYAANLLSCTTGLRIGEVLAIRKSDVDKTVLNVNHSWNEHDGLKYPKNGVARKVPLLPKVRAMLLDLLQENPHKTDDPFVFYGNNPHKPLTSKIYLNELKTVCNVCKIDAKVRGIVFHSHRHYYAARMTDKMTAEQVSRITGHKSMTIFSKYADHVIDENLQAAGSVAADVFANLLNVRQ